MPPEIPREGDLISLPEATKTALSTLRNDVNSITAPGAESHRKFLDAAITSGNRADVVRALQHLQTQTEFGSLRDRIEKMRLDVSGGTAIGIPDQALVYGEQAARYTYQKLLPDWAKLGAMAGAAAWLVTWPISWFAPESFKKWRKGLVAGAAVIGAASKGASDIFNSNMPLGNRLARQVPIVPAFVDPAPATVDLAQRTKMVRDHLSQIDFQRPLTNNRLFIPAVDTAAIPVTEIIVRQYVDGQTAAIATNTVPLPVAAGSTMPVDATATRVEVEFRVREVTTPIPPIVIQKPAS